MSQTPFTAGNIEVRFRWQVGLEKKVNIYNTLYSVLCADTPQGFL